MMHGYEKSDPAIVALKPANKAKEAHCGGICGGERSGVGGAKGAGQGEYAPAKHVLDSEPGSRGKGAGAHTATFAVKHPRQEPYAGKPHVRFWAGACDETHVPTATQAPRVHGADRWRGCVAARGARAAGGEDAASRRCRRHPEIITAVAQSWREHGAGVPLVVDPVSASMHGDPLLDHNALDSLRAELFPLATLVTPNLHEVRLLVDIEVVDSKSQADAARALHALGPQWALVKGGHLLGSPSSTGMSSCAICGWFLVCVPTQIVASISTNAATTTLGAGINHAHQLCFTGSAATRARTRKSKAAEGSIIGSSSNSPLTARNSLTRRRHAAHPARCFSTSSRSLSFKRPSRYPRILFSIRLQLMTSPSLPNGYDFPCCATSGASSTRSVS